MGGEDNGMIWKGLTSAPKGGPPWGATVEFIVKEPHMYFKQQQNGDTSYSGWEGHSFLKKAHEL